MGTHGEESSGKEEESQDADDIHDRGVALRREVVDLLDFSAGGGLVLCTGL